MRLFNLHTSLCLKACFFKTIYNNKEKNQLFKILYIKSQQTLANCLQHSRETPNNKQT